MSRLSMPIVLFGFGTLAIGVLAMSQFSYKTSQIKSKGGRGDCETIREMPTSNNRPSSSYSLTLDTRPSGMNFSKPGVARSFSPGPNGLKRDASPPYFFHKGSVREFLWGDQVNFSSVITGISLDPIAGVAHLGTAPPIVFFGAKAGRQ